MTTYNGCEYIISQIDSILNQKYVDVHILIRDDRSKDTTVDTIKQMYSNDPRIELIEGENNIGCVNGFNFLVKEAVKRNKYDYFAFSDQDDVWCETKLSRSIEFIEKFSDFDNNVPKAYCGNLMVSDCNAKPVCPLYYEKEEINKTNILVINKAVGCTMLFNRKMAQFYSEHPAKNPSYHDYWMALIAIFLGKLYFDNTCHIFYRQHRNNVAGVQCLLTWKLRIKHQFNILFAKNDNSHIETIKAFFNEFKNELSCSDAKKFKLIINYKNSIFKKLKILCSFDFYPDCSIFKYPLKHISFVLKILLGKL